MRGGFAHGAESRVMNGKHANHCHRCGGHWQDTGEGYGTSYNAWRQEQRYDHDTYQQWPKPPRHKSPRTWGKGKQKGRGKSPRPKKPKTPCGGEIAQPPPPPDVPAVRMVAPGLLWMQAAQNIDFSRSPSCSCPDTTGVQVVNRHTSEESIQRHFAGGCATGNENDPSQRGKRAEQRIEPSSQGFAESTQRAAGFLRSSLTAAHAMQGFTSQFQAQEQVAMTRISETQQTLREAKAQLASSKEIAELASKSQAEGSIQQMSTLFRRTTHPK